MSRLTEKYNGGYVLTNKDDFTENSYQVIQKLGKLEDLEEQLGCPLEVVIKALKDGIYTLDLPREDLIKQVDLKLSNRETEWYLINMIMVVNLKDYKKTFWLKEDKSE